MGGFAAQGEGWRRTIWDLAWLCTAVRSLLFFLMPETRAASIYLISESKKNETGDRKRSV
jgi:hypothetical protein